MGWKDNPCNGPETSDRRTLEREHMNETLATTLSAAVLTATISLTATFPEPSDLRQWVVETVTGKPEAAQRRTIYTGYPESPRTSDAYQTHAVTYRCLDLDYDASGALLRHCASNLPRLLDQVEYGDTLQPVSLTTEQTARPGTDVHKAAIRVCRILWVRGEGSWLALEQPLCELAGINLDSLTGRM